jgi:ATP-dependent RNA helicase DeaD
MDQFREGHINILVATDLAARGIDVKEISYVVNYHLPDAYESYVHRSGRTARAGAKEFHNGTARRRGARNCRL